MKTSTVVWIVIIIIIVLGGWWWFSQSGGSSAPPFAQTPTEATTAATPPVINTVTLGTGSTSTLTYLTGANGMTLYTFDKDSAGTTTCYGQCEQIWPPYTVAPGATVTAPAGATGQTGTLQRADGSMQVTYNGMPLYFYAQDSAAGDVLGDGVKGVWHAAKL